MTAAHEALAIRSQVEWAIRRFFHERDFLEVTTPVRLQAPALEEHIDAEPSGSFFLRTSPELHMKRLLAAGFVRIFQMGPCFRQGERGSLHNPEYTMLEWYRAGSNYGDILADTQQLLSFVAREVHGSEKIVYQGQALDLRPTSWRVFSVAEAFREYAGWDPCAHFDADRFDIDLVEKVEPALPRTVPVVLKDYPAERAALARRKDGGVAERWEFYVAGIELANAYSELNDAAEQRRRFLACAEQRRKEGRVVYPLDEKFLAALESGMPAAGGIALGVDRLAMLMADVATIGEILAFQE